MVLWHCRRSGTFRGIIVQVRGRDLRFAVTLGGHSLDDPEIEYERSWVQGFRMDQPELARKEGQECKGRLTQSGWTPDGAMQLFKCIRAKAEAQGFYYE